MKLSKTFTSAALLLVSITAHADDTALRLHTYLHTLCPDIVGVSLPDPADRTTWQITLEGAHNCGLAAQAGLLTFHPADVTLPRNITKTAFLSRFTHDELLAISAAARANDTINVWLITAQSYDAIDLNNPLTDQGLTALVNAALLTPERKAAILGP